MRRQIRESAARFTRSSILLLCFVFLIVTALHSVAIGTETLTLAGAINAALENNYELKSMKNSVLAQKAEIGIARSAFLPKITFEERVSRTNNPPQAFMMKLNQERFSQDDFILDHLNNPRPVNDYQTAFFIEQPVLSVQSFWRLSQANSMHNASISDFSRKKEEIVFKIVEAYLSLDTARQYRVVSLQGLEDAREHLRVAQVRYNNNVGLYSDVLRAETAVAEAQQVLVTAEKNHSIAKSWLGVLLATSEDIDIADEHLSFDVKQLDFYQHNSFLRQDISALRARYEAAKKEVKAAEASYFPYVGFGGSYYMNDHRTILGSEGTSWQISAFLRWNIFDGFKRESERLKANYQSEQIKENLNNMHNLVLFGIQEAYLTVEETRKNADLAGSSLATAEEGKRLVESRYRNSLSPFIDLLDVQFSVNRARATLIARRNAHNLAVAKLMYESGTILKELNVD